MAIYPAALRNLPDSLPPLAERAFVHDTRAGRMPDHPSLPAVRQIIRTGLAGQALDVATYRRRSYAPSDRTLRWAWKCPRPRDAAPNAGQSAALGAGAGAAVRRSGPDFPPTIVAYDARSSSAHTAWILTSDEDLRDAADLDDAAFEGAVGIDRAYLRSIALEYGVVLGIKDDAGRLVAIAELVLSAVPHAPEYLVRSLQPDTAYLEGFAVHPERRDAVQYPGRAIALCAQRLLALHCPDKRFVACTIHPRNFRSQDALISGLGFVALGYDPHYYGEADEAEEGRFIAVNDMLEPSVGASTGPMTFSMSCQLDEPDDAEVERTREMARWLDAGWAIAHVRRDPSHPSGRFVVHFQPLREPGFRNRWLPPTARS